MASIHSKAPKIIRALLPRMMVPRCRSSSPGQPGECGLGRHLLADAGLAVLDLDHAVRQAARPADGLPGQPDQTNVGELRARPLVAVVHQHVEAGTAQLHRKSVGWGKTVSVRLDHGGCRTIYNNTHKHTHYEQPMHSP